MDDATREKLFGLIHELGAVESSFRLLAEADEILSNREGQGGSFYDEPQRVTDLRREVIVSEINKLLDGYAPKDSNHAHTLVIMASVLIKNLIIAVKRRTPDLDTDPGSTIGDAALFLMAKNWLNSSTSDAEEYLSKSGTSPTPISNVLEGYEWLSKQFEHHPCPECGRDADAHELCLDPIGNHFAKCKLPAHEEEEG